MGRWAQAARRGGGPPAAPPPAQIVDALEAAANQITVVWDRVIDPTQLNPADFDTIPSDFEGTSIAEVAPTETITVTFDGDGGLDNELNYSGNVAGFAPGVVPIQH